MWYLRTSGSLDLLCVGKGPHRAVLTQPKRQALLCYLAAAGRGESFHRRDTLLALFWPELDESRARAALSRAVYHLRHSLGEDVILSRGDGELGVSGERLECDATAFHRALADGRLEAALEVYRGDFLAGFHVGDAPEFEEWADAERRRFRDLAVQAAVELADRSEAVGQPHDAVRFARRAVELAPYEETVACRLMTVLAHMGDRAGALRVYEELSARLARDLEVEAATETRALVERLRTGEYDSGDVAIAAGAKLAQPVPAHHVEPSSSRGGRDSNEVPTRLPTNDLSPMSVVGDGPPRGNERRSVSGERESPLIRHPASGSARSRWITIAAVVGVIGVPAGGARLLSQQEARRARNVAIPEAIRLLDEGQTFGAVRLLRQAERSLPDDPVVKELMFRSTFPGTIRTVPDGARVYVRGFFDAPDEWEFLGSSPLELRLPDAALVWKLSLEGMSDIIAVKKTDGLAIFQFVLPPAAEAHADMVYVPGGRTRLGLLQGDSLELDGFWIDKYEVTNQRFKAFLDRGGYQQVAFWREPVLRDGAVLGWNDSRQLYRDRTGRPGPAFWEVGSYPAGQADYPIGGISWYEAAAYCASVGKRLPTVHEWYQAADLPQVEVYVQSSNFGGDGPAEVGHPLRLGGHGTYDMAGNVREWVWNEAESGRRYLLGGAWNEPSYQFQGFDAQFPLNREPQNGFRCAKSSNDPSAEQLAPVAAPFMDWREEEPVPHHVFAVHKSLYEYERTPLAARVATEEEGLDWSVVRLSFVAAYGNERVPALLFLPKNAVTPYQTVIFFPGISAWLAASSPANLLEQTAAHPDLFLFLIRSGRAVLFPVYKGMWERHFGSPFLPRIWRDMVIYSAKDLRRAVDYLETRPDIDAHRLAYFGISSGASVGPIMTAVEPRFRASVLVAGGLQPWRDPPEVEALNFAPRVRVPTLLINGRHDFYYPYETSQSRLFDLLGAADGDKRHRVFESTHIPTERAEVIREALDWLDRYLGPVDR